MIIDAGDLFFISIYIEYIPIIISESNVAGRVELCIHAFLENGSAGLIINECDINFLFFGG